MNLPSNWIMPTCFKNQVFEVDRIDYQAPEARGRIGGISAGWPLWKTTLTVGTMTKAQSDLVRAFVTAQRGSQRMFYGYEIGRQMPLAYLKGFPGGFTGSCTGWSQVIDGNGYAVLTLSGLPRGLALTVGDYVGFRWGTFQRALVRLMESGRADNSGSISVTVEMPVNTIVIPAGAVAHLDKPCCLMKIDPSNTELGAKGRRGAIESGTIVAYQDLVP